MAKFEYNWATAVMVKLYLRNSRAQEKRKSRMASRSNVNALANPGHTRANSVVKTNVGPGLIGATVDSEDSEDDDLDDD